jgi:hypothetical protein
MSADPAPRPWARWLHRDELAALEATVRHCEIRKCGNPVAVITWRWWRSSELGGKVLVTEHFVCSEHGTDRHAPSHPGRPRGRGRGAPPGRRGGGAVASGRTACRNIVPQ